MHLLLSSLFMLPCWIFIHFGLFCTVGHINHCNNQRLVDLCLTTELYQLLILV